MDAKVSVIVLACNIQDYIRECLDSLCAQTLGSIEVLIIDDGSKDETGIICDEYARKDSRIKVLHRKNSGVNASRKAGVMLASGQYIGFVDGDDWIEPEMYEYLLKQAEYNKADIVTSSGYRNYEWGEAPNERLGDTVETGLYKVSDNDYSILKKILSNDDGDRINGAVWNKLFRRDIIRYVMAYMDNDLSGEMDDNVILLGTAIRSKRIFVSHDMLYHHRERNGSYTYTQNQCVLQQINSAYTEMKRMIEDAGLNDVLYVELCKYIINRVDNSILKMVDPDYLLLMTEWKNKKSNSSPVYYYDKGNELSNGTKVILYGYGNVGKSYLKQFEAEKRIDIEAVADEKAQERTIIPEEIINYSYDYIIIAIYNKQMADEVRRKLILLGVPAFKILWRKPLYSYEYYDDGSSS